MENINKIEIVPCECCGEKFEYEALTFGGVEIFQYLPKICDSCSELHEQEAKKAKEEIKHQAEIAHALAEYERVVPKEYRLTEIDDVRFNKDLHAKVTIWARGATQSDRRSWLGLVGETGKSKTRCIGLLVKRLIWNGHKIEWATATRFQWAVQYQWRDDEDAKKATQWLKRWRDVEILVFDDLGKQKMSEAVESAFYDLLEHRSSNCKMIIWSANTHPSDMIKSNDLSKDRGAPIVGRLLDYSDIINV